MRRIILASASPRRKELLEQIGISFEVMVSDREEVFTGTEPEEIVKELALHKAENVEKMLRNQQETMKNLTIIGADTVVVWENRILGKPSDAQEAFDMIAHLQGNTHKVFTGTAILKYDEEGKRTCIVHAEETKVFVSSMTEDEIRAYITTGESKDKAGAYGIQGKFAAYIERIEGDYYNVVGLPIAYVYKNLC